MNKSAFLFLPTADSTKNKSILSYDISDSEASKSKTLDSLLPKKNTVKFELTAPIGPEPIKDFIPAASKKNKEKQKEKAVAKKSETKEKKADTKEATKAEIKIENKAIEPLIVNLPIAATTKDTLNNKADSLTPIAKTFHASVISPKIQKKYEKSIFESNLLQAHQLIPKIKHKEHNDWATSVLLVVVAIVCILNVSYRSRMRQLFNAFASNRFVGQIVREENVMFQRISIFLSLLFLIITSLFIFQLGQYYRLPFASNNSFINYSVILLALFSFYFLKITAFNFLGFLLKIEKEMKEYVFTIFLYNHFIGVGLIPLVILLAFVPGIAHNGVFITGAIIFVFAFLLRAFRSYWNVSASSRFSIFYLFLYLCTLEILPLVVITKLIINIV